MPEAWKEDAMECVQIKLLIRGNELATSVPSRSIPSLIDRWFRAIEDAADQQRIDALVQRLKAANDALEATIQANTPKP